MDQPIRIIIADDHAVFRQGLKSLLDLQPDVKVVGQVEKSGDLAPTLDSTPCDILLLDLQMDKWLLDEIPTFAQSADVVVLTASENIEDAVASMRAGARAIVQKRFAVETLMEAIRTVASGHVWMPVALQTEVAAQWGAVSNNRLTDREVEIVKHVASGMRNGEVAMMLSISEATVKTHLNNVFQKLGIRGRVALTHYALRSGLISTHDPSR